MRVGLYARVSTLHGQNPQVQLSELREHAARRGWKVVGEYVDQGVSGARERRPELDRLWAESRKRKSNRPLSA
jgi:DNA invertase Pin-like site-specific DNA recombinase